MIPWVPWRCEKYKLVTFSSYFEWKKCRYLDLLQLILHFLPQGGFPGYLEDLCCSWLFFLVSTFFCAVFAAIIRWWAMENVRWWCWGLVSPAGVWNLPQLTHQGTLHFVVWPAKSGQVPKRREGRKNESYNLLAHPICMVTTCLVYSGPEYSLTKKYLFVQPSNHSTNTGGLYPKWTFCWWLCL